MTERTRKIFDLLGVEPDEKFKIKEYDNNETYHFTDDLELRDDCDNTFYGTARLLLVGRCTIVKLPKKKKLRDLTIGEFRRWSDKNCKYGNMKCENCPFRHVCCCEGDEDFWLEHKDLYSDKFLDQEIEVGD